ncbi:TPA: AraC family transcriptional regulator, partial [Streptococcus pneumoniae]
IAESVGYSSASKFSIYYKRYKGKLPSEVRNLACKHHNFKCDYCD